jgi:hypothetical protein
MAAVMGVAGVENPVRGVDEKPPEHVSFRL